MSRRACILLVLLGAAIVAYRGYRRQDPPVVVNAAPGSGAPLSPAELERRIQLPDGFSISSYATGIDGARMLRFTPVGDLLVSAPRQHKVFLLGRDTRGDGYAEGHRVLLDGLNRPHGMALADDWLYVAETDAVLRVRFDAAAGQVRGEPERIIRGLPAGGNHWTRTIGIGPDGWLYVAIGSSCNVCIEKDARRAAISRYRPDGSDGELYATGLRNSVGFAWQPGTGQLYATDNGRDLLGDDFPPCELNRIVSGGFYGWPYANGDRVSDPDFGARRPDLVARSIPPAHAFGAHRAPLGMAFYTGSAFPPPYRGAAFVAEHGSWNRSKKVGYRVVSLRFDAGGAIHESDFAIGFERDDNVVGRPVDIAVGPDEALYISDDFTGSIYRIAYHAPARPRPGDLDVDRPTAPGDPLAGLPASARAEATAHGRQLWERLDCASCHAAKGSAPAQRPLIHLAARHTIASLNSVLLTPQPPMPAFALSDSERRDLAIFLLDTFH